MSENSAVDKGTFWQLRNLVNRTSVPKSDPNKNVKDCEDFLEHVVYAFVIHAATKARHLLRSSDCLSTALEVSDIIVRSFTNLACEPLTAPPSDLVQAYSKELLTLGLFGMGFKDATREGDGNHIIRYWRYFLILFKACHKQNYSGEAARLLMHDQLLSPQLQAQIRFSHFVNTHGWQGGNIPLDLHMEHLNRIVKGAISHSGANNTAKLIQRAGRSIGQAPSFFNIGVKIGWGTPVYYLPNVRAINTQTKSRCGD